MHWWSSNFEHVPVTYTIGVKMGSTKHFEKAITLDGNELNCSG